MAHDPTEENLQDFLEAISDDIHRALTSSVGDLIAALQDRELERAQRIAARLHQDLRLCNSDRPSYFLEKIATLLCYDDAFLHCDELSAWLLALERELDRIRTQSRHGYFDSMLRREADDERASLNSGRLDLSLQGMD